jgi:hypothetical protein
MSASTAAYRCRENLYRLGLRNSLASKRRFGVMLAVGVLKRRMN